MKRSQSLFFDLLVHAYIGWCFYFLGTRVFQSDLEAFHNPNAMRMSVAVAVGIMLFSFLMTRFSRRQGFTLGRFLAGQKEIFENGVVPPLKQRPLLWVSILFSVVTFAVGWFMTQVSLADLLSSEGFSGTQRIFTALFHPEFAIFLRAFEAIVETVFMSFMATAIALPIAFVLSFPASANLMNRGIVDRAIYSVLRFTINLCRSIEPLVWAIVFSVWVGIGPFAGMLALCVHSVVSLIKLYSEQIEVIDRGPLEAMESVGANRILIIAYGVVPQILTPCISYTIYRWDINVRMATVIGLVGGGGIGTLLIQYQGLAKWNEVGLIIILIASVVWALDILSAKLRRALG